MPSDISIVDLASLSQGVYTNKGAAIPPGYTLKAGSERTIDGMTAQTFQSPTGELVVVFTGTDKNGNNFGAQLTADRGILNGDANNPDTLATLNAAAQYAEDVARDNPGTKITITGDSLGATEGAYAQMKLQQFDRDFGTSLSTNVSTVVFSALGLPSNLITSGLTVDAYNVAWYADPATGVTQYLGNVFPGQTKYVDTGISPDGIIQGILSGEAQVGIGSIKAIAGSMSDNVLQVFSGGLDIVAGASTVSTAFGQAILGHRIGLMVNTLEQQQQASELFPIVTSG